MAWTSILELAADRTVTSGSKRALADAIGRGAELRMYTEFLFEEHIEPGGTDDASLQGPIREVIDFRQTILIDGAHVGGITTQRQPLHPPFGFNGTDPKMSYFMYTGDGEQALANLALGPDQGWAPAGTHSVEPTPSDMPKMSPAEAFDTGTSGPSRNFVYDMEVYRYFVNDEWEEVLAHDADGSLTAGSFDALEAAQMAGREIRVGVRGLMATVGGDDAPDGLPHEVFSPVGSGFVHIGARLYSALTHPLVRVAATAPLRYRSGGWDVAWVFLRTDGQARVRRLDPRSREWTESPERFGCRWFAR